LLSSRFLNVLGSTIEGYEGYIMTLIVLVIGVGKLIRNYKKK